MDKYTATLVAQLNAAGPATPGAAVTAGGKAAVTAGKQAAVTAEKGAAVPANDIMAVAMTHIKGDQPTTPPFHTASQSHDQQSSEAAKMPPGMRHLSAQVGRDLAPTAIHATMEDELSKTWWSSRAESPAPRHDHTPSP
jgi:hypothetical protein